LHAQGRSRRERPRYSSRSPAIDCRRSLNQKR
jgi:hypothetical protein